MNRRRLPSSSVVLPTTMRAGRGFWSQGPSFGGSLLPVVLIALAAPVCLTSSPFYLSPSNELAPSVSPAYTIRKADVGYGGNHENKETVHGYLYYYSPQPYPAQKKGGYEYSTGLFFTLFLVPLVALLGISYIVPASGISVVLSRSFSEAGKIQL